MIPNWFKPKVLVVPALLLLLAGCSLFRGGDDEEPTMGERLIVPPDLSEERLGQIPDIGPRRSATLSEFAAGEDGRAGGGVMPETPGMTVRRQGNDRWLEIEAATDEVWGWLNDYLDEKDVAIVRRSSELGVVETDWLPRPLGLSGGVFLPLPVDTEAPMREQYMFRLEPLGTARTELYVSHRRAMQVRGDDGVYWEPRDAERGREAEALRSFMVHMGMREEAAARAAGAAEATPALAELEEGEGGEVTLLINESFLQGWRRTALALDRAGFTVEERNRSEGRYIVRYDPGAESERRRRGFFSRLAFWREREPELEPGNYVIRVSSDAGNTRLSVLDEDGDAVPAVLAERLLVLINDQLI